MSLFIIEKNSIHPKPELLLIAQFKELWERDKTKDKQRALAEIGFVYYLADYKSVYLSTSPEEREEVIAEDLGLTKWKPDSVVYAAVKKYEELQVVPSMRFLSSQRHALEQLMLYFKNIKYQNISKPSELSKSMTDTAKMLESIDKIEERVKKELQSKGKTKGDREIGLYELED